MSIIIIQQDIYRKRVIISPPLLKWHCCQMTYSQKHEECTQEIISVENSKGCYVGKLHYQWLTGKLINT